MIDTSLDIKKSLLFKDLSNEDFKYMMTFLDGQIKDFEDNQIIFDYYRHLDVAGILLQGQVRGAMLNENGNEYSLNLYYPGDIFATSYSLIKDEVSLVQFKSVDQSQVLFIKLSNLLNNDDSRVVNEFRINLLKVIALNNINQNKRMQVLAQKSIRDKVIVYLYGIKGNKKTINLTLNRQDLADYLNVDRSALSRELSNLKKEGYIDYYKNSITVLKDSLFNL